MIRVIDEPKQIQAHGKPPKVIQEFIGRANTGMSTLSVARMLSPSGWSEPGQTPAFDEFTVVLKGLSRVETRGGFRDVSAGQAVAVDTGEWVRYSTPESDGAEYIAVCVPAFSPEMAHREAEGTAGT